MRISAIFILLFVFCFAASASEIQVFNNGTVPDSFHLVGTNGANVSINSASDWGVAPGQTNTIAWSWSSVGEGPWTLVDDLYGTEQAVPWNRNSQGAYFSEGCQCEENSSDSFYWFGVIGNVPPPVYTNYTFNIQNTLTVNATATWTYNGSVVKQEILAPGQSDSWTTPSIEVSPTPQNFTVTTSCMAVGNTINYGSDGSPGFSAGGSGGGSATSGGSGGNLTIGGFTSGSGGASGGGGGGTGGGTDGGSGTNITFTAGTNGDVLPGTPILWAPPTGSASESTLEAGFSLLHQDDVNLLQGESIIDKDLNTGFFTATNQLGQIVTYEYAQSNLLNSDTMQIVGAITNLNLALSNNRPLVSITNNVALTNALALTNYATESTLETLTDYLASLNANSSNGLNMSQLSNYVSWTQNNLSNSQQSAALSLIESYTNLAAPMAMQSLVNQLQSGLPYTSPQLDGGSGLPEQDIALPGGVTIALGTNLPTYPNIRNLIAWCILVCLLLRNWRVTYKAIANAFAANQARTAGTEVFGTNLNISSALAMAVFIMALIVTIPTTAVAIISGEATLFFSIGNPFSLLQGMGFGFQLIDHYIPLLTLLSSILTLVIYEIVVDSIASVVMAIKLFLVGL